MMDDLDVGFEGAVVAAGIDVVAHRLADADVVAGGSGHFTRAALLGALRRARGIAYIYESKKPARGGQTWTKHLLEGQDDKFELALLNALTRFGIPLLFAGQLQQEERSARSENPSNSTAGSNQKETKSAPKAQGPATPGFDLIALNTMRKRAVLISAKGITRNPGDDEIENLLKGTITVGRKLESWHVTGLIACHASAMRLVRLRERKDSVIWGQDELKALLQADTPEVVERMLWMTPGWPQLDVFLGYH